MRVLVIGGGGREHALGWKLSQSPLLSRLYFAPGNPGTAGLGTNLDLVDIEAMVDFAEREKIDLVVVGPEQPLVDGLADRLADIHIACFGPGAAAARLEGSKAFAKEIMLEAGVPTADYASFTSFEEAVAYAEGCAYPLVVKADGLAAGKGVTICASAQEARKALEAAMCDGKFGSAGERVVIEAFLEGTEASFHLISDGERFLPLVTAKDHKALLEGDRGPNTGGMGTYAPNPLVTEAFALTIQSQICEPVLRCLKHRDLPFRGVLFAGLMLTWEGPKVLEFNVRFGDPETQVILPLLDFDLLPVLLGAARGRLPDGPFPTKEGAAVCVVLASEGYPEKPRKGLPISGLERVGGVQVFHGGTRDEDGRTLTNGGRVLGVTGWAENQAAARTQAYRGVGNIHFEGMHYRKDIGEEHE